MTDLDALLILNHLRVGPITTRRMMELFGSPSAIFSASARQLERVPNVSPINARRLREWEKEVKLAQVWDTIKRENIRLLTYRDEDYPALLREIYDHPMLLYVYGELKPEDQQAVAIVGTRSPTEYGKSVARKWAMQLVSRGFTIVSGLARGIDTCAHIGALEGHGRTIAVLGFGFGYIYPRENERLYHKIIETGVVITEYPYKKYHGKSSFPLRNRLIAGMSRATLVVESRRQGGAMITAHFANDYNRTVYAVPGSVYSTVSAGTNQLIRDGATLVTSPDDICEDFGFLFPEAVRKPLAEQPSLFQPRLEENEQRMLDLLAGPLSLDDLAQSGGISVEKAATALVMLELKGLVRALPGKRYERK